MNIRPVHILFFIIAIASFAYIATHAEDKVRISEAEVHHHGGDAPKVMLAQKWKPGIDVSGWLMSEKYDGVMAYWDGQCLRSKTGKEFNAPYWFTRNFPEFALDGELWIDRGKFSETLNVVRQNEPHEGWREVKYMVFDAPKTMGGFEDRFDFAGNWFKNHHSKFARLIDQEICRDEEHLLQRLDEIDAINGEGIILREPTSHYVAKRSSHMLKAQKISENEALVIEHKPGTGNFSGKMGSLLVELTNGTRFSIGSGFTNNDRLDPPPIGSIITFKYQGFTNSGIPRFAVFKAVREDY